MFIRKRTGELQRFNIEKIEHAIYKAFKETHGELLATAEMPKIKKLAAKVKVFDGIGIEEIQKSSTTDINIIYGSAINSDLGNEIIVTVIATGFSEDPIFKETKFERPMEEEPEIEDIPITEDSISNELEPEDIEEETREEHEVNPEKKKKTSRLSTVSWLGIKSRLGKS